MWSHLEKLREGYTRVFFQFFGRLEIFKKKKNWGLPYRIVRRIPGESGCEVPHNRICQVCACTETTGPVPAEAPRGHSGSTGSQSVAWYSHGSPALQRSRCGQLRPPDGERETGDEPPITTVIPAPPQSWDTLSPGSRARGRVSANRGQLRRVCCHGARGTPSHRSPVTEEGKQHRGCGGTLRK